MNAVAAPTAPAVARGTTARRWLTVLLAVEGLVALCAAVTFALELPIAASLLGGTLGGSAAMVLLLAAGLAGALSASAFGAAGSVLRRAPEGIAFAAAIQAIILAGTAIAAVSSELSAPLAVGLAMGAIGLLLVPLAGPGLRAPVRGVPQAVTVQA